MMHLAKNKVEEILPRYCEGNVTEEERLLIESWVNSSEDHLRIAKQIHALYLATDAVCMLKKVDTEKALRHVKIRFSAQSKSKKNIWWRWIQRVAAILFIPLLTMFVLQNWGEKKTVVMQMMEVRTNPGMKATLTLPDGTEAFLNSESSLSYPSSFSEDVREVTLSGEAYFKVTKNPEKRFVVLTPHHSQIEVLGTIFNVEAYEQYADVTTTLVEGSIDFLYKRNNVSKRINLSPGQKLIYASDSSKVKLYNTSGVSETAWKDGKIILDNTPLEEALRMMEKRFGVEFIIKNERLKNSSFTGTFINQRLEKILEYFRLSSKIRWKYIHNDEDEIERDRIEIY